MEWITPKTDWVSSDYFNVSDYNRIKNNALYLANLINYAMTLPEITVESIPNVYFFRSVTQAIGNLCKVALGFFPNLRYEYTKNNTGWVADDVNAIEDLLLKIYRTFNEQNKLPFTLGGVRID